MKQARFRSRDSPMSLSGLLSRYWSWIDLIVELEKFHQGSKKFATFELVIPTVLASHSNMGSCSARG